MLSLVLRCCCYAWSCCCNAVDGFACCWVLAAAVLWLLAVLVVGLVAVVYSALHCHGRSDQDLSMQWGLVRAKQTHRPFVWLLCPKAQVVRNSSSCCFLLLCCCFEFLTTWALECIGTKHSIHEWRAMINNPSSQRRLEWKRNSRTRTRRQQGRRRGGQRQR